MIYDSKPTYDAITIPSKSKSTFDNLTRNVLTTIFVVLTFVATGYFLYSGFFVVNSGSVSRIRLSSEPIIIEFESDETADSLVPGSKAWLNFHDALLDNAGYDAAELKKNPSVDVSFIAYDPIEAQVIGGSNQVRPSRGITCYTKYSTRGTTNSQKCLPTAKITKPILTGCSTVNFESALSGSTPIGGGCESHSKDDMVTARCCQPTPNTQYEGADWVVSTPVTYSTSDPCLSAGCTGDQDLVGCFGQAFGGTFGGIQNDGNVCRAQRGEVSEDGVMVYLVVGAMCADQPQDGHKLKCQKVEAMEALLNEDGQYQSSVQCERGTVMFDCNSFLRGPIDACDEFSANEHTLYGENYRLVTRKSKIYCDAFGDAASVRAGATCCQLE